MATILEFSERAAKSEESVSKDHSHDAEMKSAQIIIFPGVRIERYDVDPFENLADVSNAMSRRTSLKD